jgi:hypothetical protein
MANGDYLISFGLFGDSLSPSQETSGTTYVYRSSDQGQTWTNLTPSPIMDLTRSSLFVHEGDTYMWGYTAAPGGQVLRKSTDYGSTWATSVLTSESRHGTPFNPVIALNSSGTSRVWCAVGGRRLMSGRSAVSLIMDPARWIDPGSAANTDDQPDFGAGVTIDAVSEAQIVYGPQSGVVVMPKVRMQGVSPPYFSYTILLQQTGNNDLGAATAHDWVMMPGAEKKFGAAYDPVSGRFYVLSNPVLAAHESGSGWAWELIRNTAAMLSSKDLYHWDVEQIFLYSTDIDHEGFQYLNFDLDSDDMIIASRTAFDISGEPGVDYPPPRGHESNMITFHRISNFRTAFPTHFLTYSGNTALRYEQTHHEPAPLGSFVLGSTFDGTALGTVNGLAQDENGDVYVREEGGRILRFDALGNFIETASGSPVPFQSSPLSISQPAYGERSWIKPGGGNWEDLANWYYWGRPDTNYEVANLGSAITADRDLTLEKTYTMKGLRFRSPYMYTFTGSGQITIEADTGEGILDVWQGTHSVNVPVVLASDTYAFAENGAELEFNSSVDLNGQTLFIEGNGQFVINASFTMNGDINLIDGKLMTDAFSISEGYFMTISVDGELVIQGDVTATIQQYINEGKIQVGIDLDPEVWYIDYDYDVTNPGMTSVYAARSGDVTADGQVNIDDIAKLSSYWLLDEPSVDIAPVPTGDGIINFLDYCEIADNW